MKGEITEMNHAPLAVPFIDKTPTGGTGFADPFRQSLVTVSSILKGEADPTWVMGSSAFAFRIVVHNRLCWSARDWWDWNTIGPETIEQLGYHCKAFTYEEDLPKRRPEIRDRIATVIDSGGLVIAWQIQPFSWGIITGYDDVTREYNAIGFHPKQEPSGAACSVSYDKIGKAIITKLFLLIPGEPNGRTREDIIRRSLAAAVAHAEGEEAQDRPLYESGLAAFEQWARALDPSSEGTDYDAACWNARLNYRSRCYARDYLDKIKADDPDLAKAHQAYVRVADLLNLVSAEFPTRNEKRPADDVLRRAAANIRAAGKAETEGIGHLKDYLTRTET